MEAGHDTFFVSIPYFHKTISDVRVITFRLDLFPLVLRKKEKNTAL